MEKHGMDDKEARLAELEKLLERKTAAAEKLIAERDAIIDRELRQYEEAAFYIRLQSRCFNLYPLLVRILLGLIDDPQRRTVFRSVINGKDIHRVAARLDVTPEEIGTTFCATVRSLSRRVEEMLELFARGRRLREEKEELRMKYLEAQAERARHCCNESYFRLRTETLGRACRKKEAEAERLHEKLKQEEAARRLLEEEIRRLQEKVDELTAAGKGFFNRLLWLMGR